MTSRTARLVRPVLRPALRWILQRVARAYVAGDRIEDAARVAARLAGDGLMATLGYWNDELDSPRQVADQYLDCLRLCCVGDYVSIKLPAIDYSHALFDELEEAAGPAGPRLHFDALQPETAARTRAFIDALPEAQRVRCGVTLPGRWERSSSDAQWAAACAVPVRVVKGQWPDPQHPDIDARVGFERIVQALAGRAVRVAIATHDAALAREALVRLIAAGTPCELELLYGLPRRRVLAVAAPLGVRARVYVGYGYSFVPYAAGRLLDDPRRLAWLLRDAVGLKAR